MGHDTNGKVTTRKIEAFDYLVVECYIGKLGNGAIPGEQRDDATEPTDNGSRFWVVWPLTLAGLYRQGR
jgi:hypothetical protein